MLGYLLGSIPFGLFFTWISGAGDVRKIGSGNIGATNVLRTGKKWAAAATLAVRRRQRAPPPCCWPGICLPPGAEIFAATWRGAGPSVSRLAELQGRQGRGDLSGHLFRAVLAGRRCWWPPPGWARRWSGASHRSSALIAIALSSAYFLFLHHESYAALALLLSLLIYCMHRDNIRRLLRGEEPRIGAKSSAKA